MKTRSNNKILAANETDAFVGRDDEIEGLTACARGENGPNSVALLAAPGGGTSEILRQVYDRLFNEQDIIIPVYFELKIQDKDARGAALRFLRDLLLQTVAFRRRDARIIGSSPEICEIAELAMPDDGYWIDRLVETCHSDSRLNDDRSFVRNCLSAPRRAFANGAKTFVMIDGTHVSDHLEGGELLFDELKDVAARSAVPFVISGLRRHLFAKTAFDTIELGQLPVAEAGAMAEKLAANAGVPINDQTRDLIAVLLGATPTHITSLFAAAAGGNLTSFEQVARVYTDEIFGGRIGTYYDAVFDRAIPDRSAQINFLRLMAETMNTGAARLPAKYWQRHSDLDATAFDRALKELHCQEIVNLASGSVELDLGNTVVCDYIRSRARLEIDGNSRALAVGRTLAENIKRAPHLMAGFYRRTSAIGLRELMLAFDGQQISAALIDYGRFKAELKGADDEKILKSVNEDKDRIDLPQIVYTAHTSAFYPPLSELCETERSAVGLGFAGAAERVETAWIAAEIDSKLEATREVAEFWCDRLEMVAESNDLAAYRLWLIAPEGFAEDALAVLSERNAYGSSRKQVELLAGILSTKLTTKGEVSADEYEIVVPMGEDAEMIAAHTIEDIAKRYAFPQKAVNQIKTAVVEACINAAEHSLSPDRKIYQKFTVDDDKLTITISNRGLRLADAAGQNRLRERVVSPDTATDSANQRRGWGLKLIEGLMDEVRVEQTDDGARITMVKYLRST